MTTYGGSPVSDLSLKRRSLLAGGAGGAAALATAAALGYSGPAAAEPGTTTAAAAYDLDKGNVIRDLNGMANTDTFQDIAPMDVTLHMRVTHMSSLAWFDAWAPYHPTAVGIYSRIPRRPSSESTTNRNKNIAIMHATYQVIKGVIVEREPLFRQLMLSIGLNPDDASEDPTSPVGIGNLAGKGVVAGRLHDGMNQLGDEGGRRYNRRPYMDYTGYRPVNTAYELTNPSRWQPQLTPHRRRHGAGVGDKGIFIVQSFVTPQVRLTKAHTFTHPGQFHLAPPDHSDHTRRREYKQAVDDILEQSFGLNDERKVMAEFFDDKLLGIGHAGIASAMAHDARMTIDDWVALFLTTSTAIFDALIAVWHQKAKYDAVRPFSAIRHVYGNRKVSAWGGVGRGPVRDLPADQWSSYLNVGDHSEYPSGSTTLCSAEAQAARRFFNDDVLEWSYTAPPGWTKVEAGITPASAVELHWSNWTDYTKTCAVSRVWGGVHFRTTTERSIDFGRQFGDLAFDFVRQHVQGRVRD